jgi:hypothetical protein
MSLPKAFATSASVIDGADVSTVVAALKSISARGMWYNTY